MFQDENELNGNNGTHIGNGTEPQEYSQSSRSSIQRSTLSEPLNKRVRTVGPVARQNELLQTACSYLQSKSSQNDIPAVAKAWGEKLNTLSSQQRLFAEKAINDILFEASMSTLHRHSVKINEGSSYEPVYSSYYNNVASPFPTNSSRSPSVNTAASSTVLAGTDNSSSFQSDHSTSLADYFSNADL